MANSPEQTNGIAEINDQVRRTLTRDRLAITRGIQQLGTETVNRIFEAIEHFDDFTPDNDPYGERDMGNVEVDGHRVFFKFDYYDNDLGFHSPDTLNRAVTRRVLTIMLAEEY